MARVEQIRGLLAVGMSTRLIQLILPCLNRPDSIIVDDVAPATVALLEQERARMDSRIECLVKNRDAISRYLDAVTAGASEIPVERSAPQSVVPQAVGPESVARQVVVPQSVVPQAVGP